jgi:uncharacterized membrane protein
VESLLRSLADGVALAVELVATLFIAMGVIEVFVLGVPRMLRRPQSVEARRYVWRQFGTWLLLALEFELAADIIRSALSPSWTDIGQLAAIAVIRTFLNYFLERDLAEVPPSKDT